MARVPIGDLVDHDHRLYAFERDSKLPRGTFDPDRWVTAGDLFAVAVTVCGFVLALACGWGGQ